MYMISWPTLAKKFGYDDSKALLQDLYVKKKMSLMEVSDMLIVSDRSVANHLRKLGINIRTCGGANNIKGGYKCKQRVVRNDNT